jgi:hypothetical protein
LYALPHSLQRPSGPITPIQLSSLHKVRLIKIFLRCAIALGGIHFSGWRFFARFAAFFAATIGPDHADTAFIAAQNPVFPVIIVFGDFFFFV